MRIKIDDKIYRLKEIESGVDSLMELVEEPRYKDGDFVVCEFGTILIFKEADGDRIFDHAYLPSCGELVINEKASYEGVKRHATTEEKKRMTEALAERGKCWNKDKKCVEDIPKRKFKAGDKVKIKDGISSKTHSGVVPGFNGTMDEFIGKELTVEEYSSIGWVVFYEDDYGYQFSEDWIESYTDELKKGDLAIFWNLDKWDAFVGKYNGLLGSGSSFQYQDHRGNVWANAIKFESKEQFEKVMKGEL